MNRIDSIRTQLTAALAPDSVNIIDDSHRHAGHASAGGGGHFRVQVVASAFVGKTTLQRHRMIYDALDELIKSNEVHAISIDARTPDES